MSGRGLRKSILVTSGAIIGVLAISYGLLSVLRAEENKSDAVTVELGKTMLRVPREYLSYDNGSSVLQKSLLVQAIYPDFVSPWEKIKERPPTNRTLPLDEAVWLNGIEARVPLSELSRHKWATSEIPPELDPRAGLSSYVERIIPGVDLMRTDVYLREEVKGQPDLLIRCDPLSKEYRTCKMHFIQNGVLWKVQVKGEKLKGRVRDMECRLRKLIRSFETSETRSNPC